jgi:CDP-paratose 2-epimerase
MKIIITGSTGLIGTEATLFYTSRGHEVFGIDNDSRKYFFGEDGSTKKKLKLYTRNM